MSNLETYRKYVLEIKKYAAENGISAAETNKIFEQCFRTLDLKLPKKVRVIKTTFRLLRCLACVLCGLVLCALLLYNHQTTHKLVLRNLQDFIYPGLKNLRKIAIPVIKRYPSLTEWYDEWCLVENPYFRVSEMDCWPCSTVRSIPNLTTGSGDGGNATGALHVGIPYTRVEADGAAGLNDLLEMYARDAKIFDEDANRVSSNNASYRTIGDVFHKRFDEDPTSLRDTHVTWRVTRMRPGRLIRKLFPRPIGVPPIWSQSPEKFVFVDEPRSPIYSLPLGRRSPLTERQFLNQPNPECSNVVVKCTSGARLVNMLPSPECLLSCDSFTIMLSAGHTLWYNWWYWRPLSIPAVNSTDISVNYLVSFC